MINVPISGPFRWWCQTVLPLVYDESLSYYEVLCKTQDFINKLIEQDKEFSKEFDKVYREIGSIEQQTNALPKKYLFIGDSYAYYSQWPANLAEYLGLVEDESYWIVSESGSGFASGTWLTRLQTWVTNHPDEVDGITDIVCAGGINDAINTYFPFLDERLNAFGSYCKNTFDNAKVYLAYIGGVWYNANDYSSRPAYNQIGVIRQWAMAGKYNMIYLPGCETVMMNKTFYNSDGIHPNSDGSAAICAVLRDAISCGCARITHRGNVNITPYTGVTFTETSVGTMEIADMTSDIGIGIGIDSITGYTLGNNTWQPLGYVDLPFSPTMHSTPCDITIRVGATYSKHRGEVRIFDGVLSLFLQEQDPQDATAWLSYTPNRIIVKANKSGNAIDF